MDKYTNGLNIALVYFIDRSTQDDRKSKLKIEALFSSVPQCEDNYIIRNPEVKRYMIRLEWVADFERFYNHIQDINAKYGEKAIFHINDIGLDCDLINKFRYILDLYTDTTIK